jgi:tetratricopeptide (TPR) repeat protein
MNVSDHIKQFGKQYPQIRPFEEEDDVEWWNEGLDLLNAGKLDAAEETFKKLVLAQPDHSDGFEGLGLVYEKRGDPRTAELFLREAAFKIDLMVQAGSMDAVFRDKIRSCLNRVVSKQQPPGVPPAPK